MITRFKCAVATGTVATMLSGCFPTVPAPDTTPNRYSHVFASAGDDLYESNIDVGLPDPPEPLPDEPDVGAAVAVIKVGQRAPYTGLLLSPKAAAETIAEIRSAPEECRIECDRDLAEQRVAHDLALVKLQAEYDSLQESCTVRVNTRDETIEFMEKKLEKVSEPNTMAWFAGGVGGGFLLGIALSIGVFATTNEIRE